MAFALALALALMAAAAPFASVGAARAFASESDGGEAAGEETGSGEAAAGESGEAADGEDAATGESEPPADGEAAEGEGEAGSGEAAQGGAAAAPDAASLQALDVDAFILVERGEGKVLAAKNEDSKMYPASTTKIMTGILAIESGRLEEAFTASEAAIRDIDAGGTTIGIVAGEQLRLESLLYALLVKSANESANIIAENIAGERQAFIDMMNAKARELGMTGTNYVNAHGLHREEHYTTARDLAILANYAMDNPTFRKYVSTKSFELPPTQQHPQWETMRSTNQLLLDESPRDYAVTGVKTGYTVPAGQCLVASAVGSDDLELLCVVLGARGESSSAKRYSAARELLEYGFANYTIHTFVRENDHVETVSVLGGDKNDTVEAVAGGSIRMFMPRDESQWSVSRVEYVKSEVVAPVSKGQVLGYVEYRKEGAPTQRVDVVAGMDVVESRNGAPVEAPKREDSGSGWSEAWMAVAGQAAQSQAGLAGALDGSGGGGDGGDDVSGGDGGGSMGVALGEGDVAGAAGDAGAARAASPGEGGGAGDAAAGGGEAGAPEGAYAGGGDGAAQAGTGEQGGGEGAEGDPAGAEAAEGSAPEEEGHGSALASIARNTLITLVSIALLVVAVRTFNLERRRRARRRRAEADGGYGARIRNQKRRL